MDGDHEEERCPAAVAWLSRAAPETVEWRRFALYADRNSRWTAAMTTANGPRCHWNMSTHAAELLGKMHFITNSAPRSVLAIKGEFLSKLTTAPGTSASADSHNDGIRNIE